MEKVAKFVEKHGYWYASFMGSVKGMEVYIPVGPKSKKKHKYVVVEDGKVRFAKKKEYERIERKLML